MSCLLVFLSKHFKCGYFLKTSNVGDLLHSILMTFIIDYPILWSLSIIFVLGTSIKGLQLHELLAFVIMILMFVDKNFNFLLVVNNHF
jgi:hypothetical protein